MTTLNILRICPYLRCLFTSYDISYIHNRCHFYQTKHFFIMTDIIDCDSSPCIHGTCIYGIFSYHCDCNAFFGGINCEEGNIIIANESKMNIKEESMYAL